MLSPRLGGDDVERVVDREMRSLAYLLGGGLCPLAGALPDVLSYSILLLPGRDHDIMREGS